MAVRPRRTAPPFEMLLPSISSRVESSRQLTGARIESGDVGSLVVIAREAYECEVVGLIGTAMFAGNHVIDLEREDIASLGEETILADPFRSRPNLVDERGTQSLLGRLIRVQPHAGLGLQQ